MNPVQSNSRRDGLTSLSPRIAQDRPSSTSPALQPTDRIGCPGTQKLIGIGRLGVCTTRVGPAYPRPRLLGGPSANSPTTGPVVGSVLLAPTPFRVALRCYVMLLLLLEHPRTSAPGIDRQPSEHTVAPIGARQRSITEPYPRGQAERGMAYGARALVLRRTRVGCHMASYDGQHLLFSKPAWSGDGSPGRLCCRWADRDRERQVGSAR